MKRLLNIALTVATVCCLSLAVTSCKDDDNDSNNGNGSSEQTDGELAAADRFWAVAANLVSPFDVTDDYADKTFEPTIGQPLNGNDAVRVVNCGSAEVASLRFNDITGASIDEKTATYTYHDDAVGTLTYNKTDDGQSLATVDVSIKQIPGLQRIVYKTQEQMGDNGSFKGTPYYSFGDVVKLTDNGRDEYWVCVRPAIGPAGKEDTHWITVSPLSDANIKALTKNGKTYHVPTKLGTSEEHMQNLAEMLYAMYNPLEWRQHIDKFSSYGFFSSEGLPIFHDLKPERVQYFDSYYWGEVFVNWYKNDLFRKVFSLTSNEMRTIFKTKKRLHLLGSGYTGTVGLYQWTFSNGPKEEQNMHNTDKIIVKQTGAKLDSCGIDYITQVRDQAHCYWVNEKFFGDSEPRFVFRTATGKELRGSNPGVYGSLEGGRRNIIDVYTYTSGKTHSGLTVPYTPRSRPSASSHYQFGDVYKDQYGHRWFVIRPASFLLDPSNYAQLISFDGLKPSDDNRYITNLPTLSQAIRTATILQPFFGLGVPYRKPKEEIMNQEDIHPIAHFIVNYLENCGVDARMLFQIVKAQNGDRREGSVCVSIAYNDPEDTSDKQRLLRMIKNSQNTEKEPQFHFWTNYPANPDSTTVNYAENAFSKTPIYLQDMAEDTFLQKHWNWDSYAKMPLESYDSWEKKYDNPNRTFLTTVNEKANDVTNYYYNREIWQNRTFPTDMWNAPVLMYRVTDVLDISEENYSKTSEDNFNLTLVSKASRVTDDVYKDFIENNYRIWVVDFNNYWINEKQTSIFYKDFHYGER